MLLVPQTAFPLQLRWSSGASDLAFSEATRCTLVVQADVAEVRLPREWRLQWVSDSLSIQFVAAGTEACLLDEAQVSRIEGPATAADSAANLFTAYFCSDESETATMAEQVVDLPAGGHGKLKVVALDPTDSSRAIASNEVTYNGGIEGGYPPVVLHASSVHQSLQLEVTVTGSGLGDASSLSIMAPDSSWSLPLTVTARSDASLTGVASVAAILPACQATVGAASGAVSAASLPADEEPAFEGPLSCSAQYFEELVLPPPPGHGYTIQPKDFSFTRGFVDASSNRYALHLFYIRQSYYNVDPDSNTRNLGHIWTTDFNSWYGPDGLNKADTTAIVARPGKFDELHVWAPTIVEHGPTFWMFYTGVRKENGKQHQRIGRATSTDLITWTQADDVVLTAPDVPWASKNPLAYGGAQQLRDPFVMRDPLNPGQWLMYFVAVDSLRAPKMAVGVARSSNLINWFAFQDPFSATERPTFQGATNVVESPHVFQRNGRWWMPYTVNGDQIFFETTASTDPADTVAANWSDPVWLRGVAEGDPSELQYWHASEHLKITSAAEYLAAFNDNATSIEIKGVFPPANAAVDSFRLDCPVIAGVGDGEHAGSSVGLSVSRQPWGTPEVGLRIELPAKMAVRLAAYDIAGRRLATLVDRELPAGRTDVTWNGRSQGTRMSSGVYFLRLTYAGGAQVSKIVMLR
jgi:hypothetical protein